MHGLPGPRIPTSLLWLAAVVLLFAGVATAYDGDGDGILEPGEDETAELARAVQNPVASLISLPFQNNTSFDFGPRDGTLNVLNIQPVWPFELTEDWNLITRTIVPIVSQPALRSGQNRESGLGDIVFTAFLSPAEPVGGKVIVGAGPAFLLPTATDDRLGSDEWGLGPSLVVLAMPGDFVVGSLFSQVWSFAGTGDDDVSLFTWQPFVNYNFDGGWYLTTSPIVTGNFEADKGGDTWTVPVGGGFGRVFRIAPLPPMNVSTQAFYNVAKPTSVGHWSLRLQLQLLFPKGR